jgi:transposase InsO family protein
MLGVSESGYYRRLRSSRRVTRRVLLLVKIKEILNRFPDNYNYGARRVHAALLQDGETVSYCTVYRVMKGNGLVHKKKKHPNGITQEDAAAQKAQNLIGQDFTQNEPGKKWLTDITQVPCRDGKLYVAPVLDCFNGEIVGLAMDSNMCAGLCVKAFENACNNHNDRGMILHSDRGSQFTSTIFRTALACHGAVQSMSGTGKCYDNARMESFFATLKKEKLYRIRTEQYTVSQVKTIIFRYIMVYYNRQRVCSFNPGGWPPVLLRKHSLCLAA